MSKLDTPTYGLSNLYITGELDRRPAALADYRQEMLAIQELAARMADRPEDVLPRFVDLAMEITGGISAGISLYEAEPAPGVFRWRYLRGTLAPFDGATTPRNFSPCGVTLDQNGPVLSVHPERVYDWISDASIVVPEVLLVPLYLQGSVPLGTLWIISEKEGHFHREHARAMTELASFVGIALRMLNTERKLLSALEEQETLTKEMSHRVKNLFAITDGMIRMSARTAADKNEMARALSGRLHALASAHSLVSRNLREVGRTPRTGDVGALIRAVVAPHDHAVGPAARRFLIDGPVIPCGDRAMNGVALIFHELTTNAAKYGALTSHDGRVEVRWVEEGEDLILSWSEHGGPPVAPAPSHDGFGSALVRSTVASQFRGALTYDWKPHGLQVTLRIPLAKLAQ
ncbi:MAG: histidine kinase [Caulobacteraceae bacterium]|nr:histidine kinase [Caulobacteraceae bacterium]